MKTITFFYLACFSLLFVNKNIAQTYYYETPSSIDRGDYEVSFDNIVSKRDYCKMATKIDNNSANFMLLEAKEIAYTNDKIGQNHKNKTLIIPPGKKKTFTMKFSDEGKYNIKDFSVDFGGLYLLVADEEAVEAPNFNLPASENQIQAGDFKISLKLLKKETQETVAIFAVQYFGEKIALVQPNNLAAVFTGKDDVVYANHHKWAPTKILKKGDKCMIKAIFNISAKEGDMQFVPMQIVWKDTFRTATKEGLDSEKVDFKSSRKK